MTQKETVFTKDLANRKLTVERSFDAALEQVWKAWTESEILDQWWAPKPYRAETQSMDFREGGMWLYAMAGPGGDRSWCREDYTKIAPQQNITNSVSFCDEEGRKNADFPTMYWDKQFRANETGTGVTVEITFDREADMETIIQMGFKEGFTAGLDNLEDYLGTKA